MISWFALSVIAGAVIVTSILTIFLAAIVVAARKSKRGVKRAQHEATVMQEIHSGLGKLDERVGSLETLVSDQRTE
jgi:hypothetical protein